MLSCRSRCDAPPFVVCTVRRRPVSWRNDGSARLSGVMPPPLPPTSVFLKSPEREALPSAIQRGFPSERESVSISSVFHTRRSRKLRSCSTLPASPGTPSRRVIAKQTLRLDAGKLCHLLVAENIASFLVLHEYCGWGIIHERSKNLLSLARRGPQPALLRQSRP